MVEFRRWTFFFLSLKILSNEVGEGKILPDIIRTPRIKLWSRNIFLEEVLGEGRRRVCKRTVSCQDGVEWNVVFTILKQQRWGSGYTHST